MKNKDENKRSPLSSDIEAKLMLESRRTCNLCWQKKASHIHHIEFVSKGGSNSEDNLILLCHACHSEAHTTHYMEKNLRPETLRLYKETWLDIVKRYPLLPSDTLQKENDLELIKKILKFSDRRALYYPLNIEDIHRMFCSLDGFRQVIQRSGYRLINDSTARDYIKQIYKALIEIELLKPSSEKEYRECMYGFLGKSQAEYFEIRRKTIRYYLNELCKLIGSPEMFADDEAKELGIDFDIRNSIGSKPSCFKQFNSNNSTCIKCDFAKECELTLS